MSAPAFEQLTLLQDLRNAQVGRILAEDRLREYEQAEQDWLAENARMADVCAHNWQEINRLNSDLLRVRRTRIALERTLTALIVPGVRGLPAPLRPDRRAAPRGRRDDAQEHG